jgi:hypothetical protein
MRLGLRRPTHSEGAARECVAKGAKWRSVAGLAGRSAFIGGKTTMRHIRDTWNYKYTETNDENPTD